LLKDLDLKWKISLILSIVVIIVMTAVSLLTYGYTKDIMSNQILDKIKIIKENQRETIISEIDRLQDRIEYFASFEKIYNLVNMSDYYVNEGELIDITQGTWLNTFIDRSNLITNNNRMLEDVKFSYVTTKNGVVLADSRIDDENNIKEYIGKILDEEKYKYVSNEQVQTRTCVLFQYVKIILIGKDRG